MKIRILKETFYNSISKEEFYDEKSAISYFNHFLKGGDRKETLKSGKTCA